MRAVEKAYKHRPSHRYVTDTHHIIHDASPLRHRTALKPHMHHVLDQLSSRDIAALESIKIHPADLLGALRHGL